MLQHVSLEVGRDQVERSATFWELLGFERVEPPPALRDRATWLERSGTQVHLMLVDDPVAPPQGHAAVVAVEYDATLAALREAGFEPEPRSEHWGVPRCFVRDPIGHRVEVMSAPPPRSR